jgi:hypothetical protein
MNEIFLCQSLRDRLTAIVEQMQLPTDTDANTLKAPRVVSGFLEPKRSRGSKEDEPDFPYIIVRPPNGQTTADQTSTAQVNLIIGCHSDEFDGYEYCLHVMSEVRRGLMTQPNLNPDAIGSVFRMEYPFEWELPDDQPWPEFLMLVKTRWTIATPIEIPDPEVFE